MPCECCLMVGRSIQATNHTLDNCHANPMNPNCRLSSCLLRLNDFRRLNIPIPSYFRDLAGRYPHNGGRPDTFAEEGITPPPPPPAPRVAASAAHPAAAKLPPPPVAGSRTTLSALTCEERDTLLDRLSKNVVSNQMDLTAAFDSAAKAVGVKVM